MNLKMAPLKHVYCFQVGSEDCYKIGLTKNAPKQRMRGFATGSPSKFTQYRVEATEHPRKLEKCIHTLLSAKRAENGEFFYATGEEVDRAFDEALAFVAECQPLVAAAEKLREQKPANTVAAPTEVIKQVHRELSMVRRERLLLDQRIEFLESKIQVAIGQNRGMAGIASWDWVDNWQFDITAFKDEEPEEYARLYEVYNRNIGTRRFILEKVALTKGQ
jgi:T5orf172 domain